MFLEFYKLKEQPFGVTPDPRFLYLSPSHAEAIASLYCAIENGRGFSVMVAEPGMGKTSILFRLLDTLKSRARTAFLFQSDCNSRELFHSLMLDIGLEVTDDLVQMRESLNRLLLEEHRAGRRFVVVLDEAQNLSTEVLESIRLLSNFETPTEKLLHIVLAGQPQLATTLATPEMVQLNQRVSAVVTLAPLSLEETKAYIRHRLSLAGRTGSEVFTDDAYALIAQLSGGIPRNVSNICFQAMSVGCALRSEKIHPAIVSEVANDLGAAPERPVSANAPFTARPWTTPNVPIMPPPQWQRRRMRVSKFGLAAVALVSGSFFTWQAVGSHSKREPKLRSEAVQPADSLTSLTTPTKEPPAAVPAGSSAGAVTRTSAAPGLADNGAKRTEPQPTLQNPTAADLTAADEPRTIPASTVDRSREERGRPHVSNIAHTRSFPRVIYVDRSESLFQVALENYGKANRTLVYRIQIENPSLKDPDVVLLTGQRLVLPNVPASELNGKEK